MLSSRKLKLFRVDDVQVHRAAGLEIKLMSGRNLRLVTKLCSQL